MNANRRKLLGTIGGASVVGAILQGRGFANGIEQVNVPSNPQSLTPPETAPSPVNFTDRELTGKVAIITEVRNNLSRGYAVALARNGADIVVHYHREATRDQAEETARLVQQQGTRAHLVSGDLSQLANIRRPFADTI